MGEDKGEGEESCQSRRRNLTIRDLFVNYSLCNKRVGLRYANPTCDCVHEENDPGFLLSQEL